MDTAENVQNFWSMRESVRTEKEREKEKEKERENEAREKKSVHHLSLEEEHLNKDGEFMCCLCLWGLVLPSKTKETIQPHESEHLRGKQDYECLSLSCRH